MRDYDTVGQLLKLLLVSVFLGTVTWYHRPTGACGFCMYDVLICLRSTAAVGS